MYVKTKEKILRPLQVVFKDGQPPLVIDEDEDSNMSATGEPSGGQGAEMDMEPNSSALRPGKQPSSVKVC